MFKFLLLIFISCSGISYDNEAQKEYSSNLRNAVFSHELIIQIKSVAPATFLDFYVDGENYFELVKDLDFEKKLKVKDPTSINFQYTFSAGNVHYLIYLEKYNQFGNLIGADTLFNKKGLKLFIFNERVN